MSCEGNRDKYFALLEQRVSVTAKELGSAYQMGKNSTGQARPIDEAKTRILFRDISRNGLKPPTHSKTGIPKPSSQQGYAAVYDLLKERGYLAESPGKPVRDMRQWEHPLADWPTAATSNNYVPGAHVRWSVSPTVDPVTGRRPEKVMATIAGQECKVFMGIADAATRPQIQAEIERLVECAHNLDYSALARATGDQYVITNWPDEAGAPPSIYEMTAADFAERAKIVHDPSGRTNWLVSLAPDGTFYPFPEQEDGQLTKKEYRIHEDVHRRAVLEQLERNQQGQGDPVPFVVKEQCAQDLPEADEPGDSPPPTRAVLARFDKKSFTRVDTPDLKGVTGRLVIGGGAFLQIAKEPDSENKRWYVSTKGSTPDARAVTIGSAPTKAGAFKEAERLLGIAHGLNDDGSLRLVDPKDPDPVRQQTGLRALDTLPPIQPRDIFNGQLLPPESEWVTDGIVMFKKGAILSPERENELTSIPPDRGMVTDDQIAHFWGEQISSTNGQRKSATLIGFDYSVNDNIPTAWLVDAYDGLTAVDGARIKHAMQITGADTIQVTGRSSPIFLLKDGEPVCLLMSVNCSEDSTTVYRLKQAIQAASRDRQ